MENSLSSKILKGLAETLLWEYYTGHAKCICKIDEGTSNEIEYNTTTRKINKLYDHSLS